MTDSTDLDERRERPCGTDPYDQVALHLGQAILRKEALFLLRAQDISADLVVDFWIKVQLGIRARLAEGYSLEQAVQMLRNFYFIEVYADVPLNNAKLDGAGQIAAEMRKQPGRRLAD